MHIKNQIVRQKVYIHLQRQRKDKAIVLKYLLILNFVITKTVIKLKYVKHCVLIKFWVKMKEFDEAHVYFVSSLPVRYLYSVNSGYYFLQSVLNDIPKIINEG